MTHLLRLGVAIHSLLFLACGDAVTGKRTADETFVSTESAIARPSLTSTEILVLKLDPKTSIPYQDRDRTDEHFFHGFRILEGAREKGTDDMRRIENLLLGLDHLQWSPDSLRDADYGVRMRKPTGNVDLLLCMYCSPPVGARTEDALEVALPPKDVESLRAILIALFDVKNTNRRSSTN
jgi:hypothetical protein